MKLRFIRGVYLIPLVGSAILLLGFQNCTKAGSLVPVADIEMASSGLYSKVIDAETVTLEGEVTAVYEDYEDGTHKLKHYLKDKKSGKSYELRVDSHQSVRSMSHVKIKGKVHKVKNSGDVLEVTAEDTGVFAFNELPSDNSYYTYTDSGTAPYSIGEQKTLLILVNFFDNTLEEITLTEAQQWFRGLDAFVREGSKGKAWVTGDVVGWVTINQSSSVCDSYNLGNLADGAAIQRGYNIADYDRFIYAFPKNGCGYSGSGNVGGKKSSSFIRGELRRNGTLFHEYGHNLGLHHARSYACDTEILGPNCNTYEYGDTLDVMGKAFPGDTGSYNPMGKIYLGWLESHEVANITTAGIYNVIPNADNSTGGAKVLRIAKPGDPGYWLDINLYQPIGFDEIMLNNLLGEYGPIPSENIKNGIVVREAAKYFSALLDLTPNSVSCCYNRYDVALTVGKSFQDPYSGIKLTTESLSPLLGASVRVEFTDQRSCRLREPNLTVTEGPYFSDASGMPGVPTDVIINITSASSLDCDTDSLTLAGELPAGWTVDLGPMPLVVSGGSVTPHKIVITPPATAPNGTYDLYFTVSNSAGVSYKSSGRLRFSVSSTPPANKAPVAVNDSVVITTKASVNVSVLANDYDPEGKPLSIISVGRPGYGSAVINNDGTITYTPSKRFKSTDSFTYTISDGSLSKSATVSITLSGGTSEGGGGSGGGKGGRK